MLHPAIFNTSELTRLLGVNHAVMSPGSRNAPLTISFARNEKVKKWIIPDERSAGFVALGIAQMLNEPVVLCCTSGTALLNYGPAIAEAFYREIPLIVLSADRPPELIDQRDGQTIRQFEVLKNHVKASIQLPLISEVSDTQSYYLPISRAIQSAQALPKGPIHINIPFKEPFYPTVNQELKFCEKFAFQIPELIHGTTDAASELPDISSFKRILILVGQQPNDDELSKLLTKWSDHAVILKSPLNNLTCEGIKHADAFLNNNAAFQPDLLVTSGLSVLSKKVKQFLRSFPPLQHWHFDPAGVNVDTFQTNPVLFNQPLASFLNQEPPKEIGKDFIETWRQTEQRTTKILHEYSFETFSEAAVFHHILSGIPNESQVHLGNSMPVRYAELFGIRSKTKNWCNRGTSGIDGISSTAVGSALVSENLNVLISGDVSFLYDRNAFFHNYKLPNLRIVVINNQGGGIFRLIEGPANLPELNDYFETRHQRTAEFICQENGFDYKQIRDFAALTNSIGSFFEDSEKTQVLEIFVDPEVNSVAYKKLRKDLQ